VILCPECGSEIDEQALTCPLCSYVLSKMPQRKNIAVILCPECGSEVDEQALTCPLCSYVLAKRAGKESHAASRPPSADYHQKMKAQELLKFSMIFCGFLVLFVIFILIWRSHERYNSWSPPLKESSSSPVPKTEVVIAESTEQPSPSTSASPSSSPSPSQSYSPSPSGASRSESPPEIEPLPDQLQPTEAPRPTPRPIAGYVVVKGKRVPVYQGSAGSSTEEESYPEAYRETEAFSTPSPRVNQRSSAGSTHDSSPERYCKICTKMKNKGLLLEGIDFFICEDCSEKPVEDQALVENTLYRIVRDICERKLGMSGAGSPNLELENMAPNLGGYWESGKDRVELGKIKIQYHVTPLLLLGVIAHEWTHAWFQRRCPRQDATSGRRFTEGLATWVQGKFYDIAGAHDIFLKKILPTMPSYPYQDGYNYFLNLERDHGGAEELIDWLKSRG